MRSKIDKSIKQWLGVFIAIVSYYIVHEGLHLVLALLYGVFEEIRFVGILGIQIVTTEGSLTNIRLALFSGISSIVTVLMGYILAFSPRVYEIKNKGILIGVYYITLCFLVLDPLYMSLLSQYVGGGDLNGISIGLGVSDVAFKVIAMLLLVVNIFIFKNKVCPKYNKIFKEA